jgi:hypothetical protein
MAVHSSAAATTFFGSVALDFSQSLREHTRDRVLSRLRVRGADRLVVYLDLVPTHGLDPARLDGLALVEVADEVRR